MKYKITLPVLIFGILIGLQTVVSAQEFPNLSRLAQEYILRSNPEISSQTQASVANADVVTKQAIEESINTVTQAVGDLEDAKDEAIVDIKESIKQDIDASIIDIRKQTEKPAYLLQRVVDTERTQLFENVTRTIESIKPTQVNRMQEVRMDVKTSIQKIQNNLEEESGLKVNFEQSKRGIENTILRFEEILAQKKEIIESREGALVFEDSDDDGLSDYDELYIYKTDPNNARTIGEGKTDGQKISEGINPLSETEEKIKHQDPRDDTLSFVSSEYNVKKIELIKESEAEKGKLSFEGVALPNTYVTLYIYSTPIIVAIKTDDSGSWSYELERELENGEHQMFVATVDNSGKIIARSNPILFTKTADAASIGIAGGLDSSIDTRNFIQDNFILITLALLIAVVILAMMFVGNHENVRSAVAHLKNEVDQNN